MKRSIYLLTILLLALITSCKDDQQIISPDSGNSSDIQVRLLNLTSGDKIVAGSSQIIKWSSNTSTNVNLEYSTNGGNNWDTVAYNLPNTGSYIWSPVPNKISNYCLLRVSTNDNPRAYDQNSKYFSIIADTTVKSLSLLDPNNGSVVYVDSVYKIRWSSKGIASVKISLSTDNGTSWNYVTPSTPADSGYYSWRPSSFQQSLNCKMRIADVSADTISSVSYGVFTITIPQVITILQPNGGETAYAGQNYDIKWTSSQVANIKIEYTTDNGVNWSVITNSTPSNGFYSWNPVPSTISNNCKVRLSDASDGFPVVTSGNIFSIAKAPTLKIISPNGGEQFLAGSSTNITWSSESATAAPARPAKIKTAKIKTTKINEISAETPAKAESVSSPISNVKIEYTTNDGASWNVITQSTTNNGLYVWDSIPAVNSSLCKVKISDVNGGIPNTISEKSFTIYTQVMKLIKVLAPNGGEAWQAGSTQNITWTSSGVTAVKIEYTTNNGVDWKTIVESTPSNGFYAWNSVPSVASSNCRIRITDNTDASANDISDAVFSISPEPSIIVNSPNGGEVYQTGVVKQITWTSVNIANVKIEYTVNGGADWKVIVADTVSSGVYNWTVPNENTTQAKVRISKAGTGVPYGISNANFTISNQIAKTISLTAPNGGETWQGGTSQNITWSGTGVTNVKLEYTIDNGLNWTTITSSTPSSGSYPWNPVPDISATQCKVRVSDVAAGGPSSESKSTFTISPVQTIKVLSPNGGEIFVAGDPDTIKWVSKGIENVKIEFTVNNGLIDTLDWHILVASAPSNGGMYITGFSVASTKYKVRVSDAADGSPRDESDGTFTVLEQPSITVISPKDGDQYLAGSSQNISWKSVNVERVKIEYTINNGATWVSIVNDTINTGLYKWSVPNVNSSLCKIRISNSVNGGNPVGTSSGTFTINQVTPGITVISPNGGESWDGGSAQTIKWNSAGITNVKIEYTTDNGVNWSTVIASAPSNGFYSWNPIPNTPSTNCKVRITDIVNNYMGQSSATFTIAPEPAITVTAPNGGEVYQTGSVKQITWTSANIARVKIEYTVNGGADWKVICTDTASNGVYDWVVPSENTAQAKVRISKTGTGIPFGVSKNNFTINNQIVKQLTVLAPIGGESWNGGTSQQIKWSGTGITNVKIEYTTDNGITWNAIVANTPSTGAYSWNPIPNVTSTQCLIRISDAVTGNPTAVSNAVFTINPIKTITITKPVAGDIWTAGVPDTIKWVSTGLTNVKIEYTVNNGLNAADWYTLTQSTASNGVYVTGFSVASTLYKIRITGVPDGYPSVESNGTFTVLDQPSITVLTPKDGDQLLAGTSQNISWKSTNITNVKIELTTNNGASWLTVTNSTPSSGLYQWVVPNDPVINSSQCKIKISNAVNNGIPSAMSTGSFSINQVAPGITVTSPNGGESWDAGSAQAVKWLSTGVQNVKIDYTTDGGVNWTSIVSSTPSNGYYSWNPIPKTPSTNCKIKVTDILNNYTDQSDATFTIAPEPAITITAPNGGETYQAGAIKQITWTSVNIARVKIEYTVNGGADWKVICADTTSNGFYYWTVPNENTAQAKVRISKTGTGVPFGISAGNFTISNQVTKQLTVISPNGGEILNAGTSQQIKWSGSGVTAVKIEYSADNGISWNTIIASTPSTGSYSWDPIPGITSTQCLIKVSDAVTGSPYAISNGTFTINPSKTLSIIKPNAGDVWVAGVPDTIKWVSTGLSTVKIEYTINNGLRPEDWFVLTSSTASNGSYITGFSVPSTLYKVRISGASDGYPSAESNGTFTVLEQPSITVLTPKENDMYVAGTSQNITWKSVSITSVKIELTTNNGATWSTVADNVLSTGLYKWTVPLNPVINSSLCRIRVSNAVNNGVPSALSTGNFTINQIAPGITVTAPNGGETWFGSSAQVIKWNSSGITSVKIEYTTNNGVDWSTISSSTESDGYYDWNPVPNISSTNCKVRISDLSNNFADQSDAVFTISPEPSITVTSPSGGESLLAGSSKNITWTSSNISKVKIEYSTNSGASWTTITDSAESTGNYSWTVPNVNSNLCRIKVSEARTGVPFAVSANNFTINNQIIKELTLLSPVGGEAWQAGTYQTITWKATGITKVKLEFTINNGISWNTINSNVVSTGAYEWGPIPDTISSTQCKIRVSDSTGTPQDESKNVFSISPIPAITVTAPNGGETWLGGMVHDITWTSKGVANVKIESTYDNGLSWQTVVSSTPSNGKYPWSSSVPSQSYKIRISNVLNNGIPSDESDGTFTVTPEPQVTVTSPNGGENWLTGQTYEIRWTSAYVATVKIDYTLDNGNAWTNITPGVVSNGLYNWSVPTTIDFRSDLCKVRVTEIGGAAHSDMSDNTFTLHPQQKLLRVLSPNGGENITPVSKDTVMIVWTSAGITNVEIDYTLDNGMHWNVIRDSLGNALDHAVSTGAYSWKYIRQILDTASSLARVRIVDRSADAGLTPVSDESDSYFTLGYSSPAGVKFIDPGDNTLAVDAASGTQIKWKADKNISAFKLEYTSDNGKSWNLIDSNIPNKTDNVYNWNRAAGLSEKNIKYRLTDLKTGKQTVSGEYKIQTK